MLRGMVHSVENRGIFMMDLGGGLRRLGVGGDG